MKSYHSPENVKEKRSDRDPELIRQNQSLAKQNEKLQEDVTSIQDRDGIQGARYLYDARGNIVYMEGTIAERNSLRYRGYVYDQETGFITSRADITIPASADLLVQIKRILWVLI